MNLNKFLTEFVAKGTTKTLRRPVAGLRRDVASLKREVAELKREIKLLRKTSAPAQPVEPDDDAPAGAGKRLRPTAKAVLALRRKLGLTQAQFAQFAGVSALTVSKWETSEGRLHMRGRALAGFAKVKAMGRRQVKQALQEQQTPEA